MPFTVRPAVTGWYLEERTQSKLGPCAHEPGTLAAGASRSAQRGSSRDPRRRRILGTQRAVRRSALVASTA
jgi:hypothetical protein